MSIILCVVYSWSFLLLFVFLGPNYINLRQSTRFKLNLFLYENLELKFFEGALLVKEIRKAIIRHNLFLNILILLPCSYLFSFAKLSQRIVSRKSVDFSFKYFQCKLTSVDYVLAVFSYRESL